MITFCKANLGDIIVMQKLIQEEILNGIIISRSNDEVATNIRSYILAKDKNKIVGFLALHIHTVLLGEIRSLVILKSYREQGIAKNLILEASKEAKLLLLKEILVLTYRKILFDKLDFLEIEKSSLPDHKIWADCIRCQHFPVCDEIALVKYL